MPLESDSHCFFSVAGISHKGWPIPRHFSCSDIGVSCQSSLAIDGKRHTYNVAMLSYGSIRRKCDVLALCSATPWYAVLRIAKQCYTGLSAHIYGETEAASPSFPSVLMTSQHYGDDLSTYRAMQAVFFVQGNFSQRPCLGTFTSLLTYASFVCKAAERQAWLKYTNASDFLRVMCVLAVNDMATFVIEHHYRIWGQVARSPGRRAQNIEATGSIPATGEGAHSVGFPACPSEGPALMTQPPRQIAMTAERHGTGQTCLQLHQGTVYWLRT